MNHAPLINTKQTMILMAIAASCPFAQAGTAGYLSTSTAAGTSQVGPTAVYAGSEQSSINDRETARRRAKAEEAMQLLQEGRTAYTEKKYRDALDKYQAAWNTIPKAPATQKMQKFIVESIGDASIAVAIENARVGRYDDAEQLLLDVLRRDPNNARARKELSMLRDPIRNNPALTPEHVKNVEEVQRLLTLAYGYLDLADYDAASTEFKRVLTIDPYNSAAMRGLESVSKRRSNFYAAAHDAYRAEALAAVDALWVPSQPQEMPDIQTGSSSGPQVSDAVMRNTEILQNLRIAEVNFENIPVEDALDFLRAEARKAGQQINFVFEKAQAAPAPVAAAPAAPAASDDEDDEDEDEEEEDAAPAAAPVAVVQQIAPAVISGLKLSNLTAAELLRQICNQTDCEMRVEDTAVIISQKGAAAQRMVRRQWSVTPNFFDASSDDSDEDDEDSDFAAPRRKKSVKVDAKAALIDMGVSFKQGAIAKYSPRMQVLTVTNTEEELDAVEELINRHRQEMPKMVKVSAKFVEVSQQNDEELSFDWVVNPFSINDAGTAFLGGVNGQHSSPNRTFADFAEANGASPTKGSWPIRHSSNAALSSVNDTITNGLVTGGLRSGSGATNSSAIQNLINSGSAGASATSGVAPGIMSLSGIYDSGSFQMIMRGLSQKKGVDIMSAPSLVINGDTDQLEFSPQPDPLASDQDGDDNCAKIEVVKRFIYPVAYEQPQIQSGGGNGYNNNNNNNNNWNSGSMPVAAPANPSDWGVEEVGIMMRFKIEPLKEGDSNVVRFKRFEIRVVDFEGFVNYGSPITAGITTQDTIEHITLTDNRIDMPIFSRRYINSNPCVYDGHTIAIGGLIEDEVQKVEDKVPVFGDLPLIGRFFRSNAESHTRKNLMIFVTADIIDPLGKPLRQRETGRSGGDAATAAGSSIPGLFPDDGLVNP